ncbi:hypothetical protein PHK61_24310 [Actinomycetospora lutea]|uniref:hypothetical protein n=1 Tax=Actinomycetospora lutea TaxID=663604 RepID=UPI002365F45D|nr:hypothetical protein [Actinomycetospora lutea]MDD7941549.1 hypothetical protein [Actinomycetospora lutea]
MDVQAEAIARQERETRTFTRRTQMVMGVEGAVALALGGAGVVAALVADTATATAAGIRLGLPQFAGLAALGALILVTLRRPVALRRVALIAATVAAAMFVSGAVYYPHGVWDMNVAGIFLPAVIALGGFAEFVFLGSANFVTAPGSLPDRRAEVAR